MEYSHTQKSRYRMEGKERKEGKKKERINTK
jgi:hypothetical protein